MESYQTTEIIRILKEKQISFFSLADFERLFHIANKQTLYKKIARLEKKKIIRKLKKGRYLFFLNNSDDFTIANYLYQPSYVSFESALSFYGVITGFPYVIHSLTTKKTRSFIFDNKEYQYCHINPNYFWGYEKKEHFLIADKEKALLDYLYFYSKGLRVEPEWKELDLAEINKQKLIGYAKRFNNLRLLLVIKRKIL